MSLTEQIYAQALLLAGDLEEKQAKLLEVLCTAATRSLTARLRDGITPEDCKADFVAAASLYALASLGDVEETVQNSDDMRWEKFREDWQISQFSHLTIQEMKNQWISSMIFWLVYRKQMVHM